MRIIVIGATGFIGRNLCRALLDCGHQVTAVGRSVHLGAPIDQAVTFVSADTQHVGEWEHQIPLHDVVINLAGKSILTRWSPGNKQALYTSRIETTRNIVSNLVAGQVLINTSATGYFGNAGDTECLEDSPAGEGFLANLCMDWEKEAGSAPAGVRVIVTRLGVVLGSNGGALQKMLPPFKLGLGGPLGSGRQWFPWIHMNDVIGAIFFLMKGDSHKGVYHLVAPKQVTNKQFTQALGHAVKMPAVVPVPTFGLRLLFGDGACVLTDSQRVTPARLLAAGYKFQHPSLIQALENILR